MAVDRYSRAIFGWPFPFGSGIIPHAQISPRSVDHKAQATPVWPSRSHLQYEHVREITHEIVNEAGRFRKYAPIPSFSGCQYHKHPPHWYARIFNRRQRCQQEAALRNCLDYDTLIVDAKHRHSAYDAWL